jgi:hypothetical protein
MGRNFYSFDGAIYPPHSRRAARRNECPVPEWR